MGWRGDVARGLIAATVVLGAGSGCCHCGCGTCCSDSTKVTSTSVDNWSAAVICTYERKYDHAGGRGALPTPTNYCWGAWRIDALWTGSKTDPHKVEIADFRNTWCGEADRMCAHTKAVIKAQHASDGVHVAAEVEGKGALALYLLPENKVLRWTDSLRAPPDVMLAAMLPVDSVIDDMLGGRMPEAEQLMDVLKTERIKNHKPAILERMRTCKLHRDVVRAALEHLGNDALEIVFAHALDTVPCEGQTSNEVSSPKPALCTRIEQELAGCQRGCEDPRCENLLQMASNAPCENVAAKLRVVVEPPPDAASSTKRRKTWCKGIGAMERIKQPVPIATMVQALAKAPVLPAPSYVSRFLGSACEDSTYLEFIASYLASDGSPTTRRDVAAIAKQPKVSASSRATASMLVAWWREQDASARDAGKD